MRTRIGKSLGTSLVAALVAGSALLLPRGAARHALLDGGLFALSGALTNWLAIHMLFERVPGIHGSGVVPARFEEFKAGIRTLILENFFSEENIARLARETTRDDLDLGALAGSIPASALFDAVVEAASSSRLAGMLALVGGPSVLESLRQPFEQGIGDRLRGILGSAPLRKLAGRGLDAGRLRPRVEALVDARLAELTPRRVKEIVQEMIRRHLGWLVVWGGVLGGLLGLAASFLR